MSEFANSSTQRADHLTNPSEADRRITATTELLEEYARWSAYATAAKNEALSTACNGGELVRQAQRSATFAANLAEQTAADIVAAEQRVNRARVAVEGARECLEHRTAALQRSRDLAHQACQSWTIAHSRSSESRERAVQRLASAHISRRRLVALVASFEAQPESVDRQRAERDLGHAVDDIARLSAEITAADECLVRHEYARDMCATAAKEADRAVERHRASTQLLTIAQDHVASSAAVLETSATTLRRQQEGAGGMTQHAILSLEADEQASRALSLAHATYDETFLHLSEIQRVLQEISERFRHDSSRGRNGMQHA